MLRVKTERPYKKHKAQKRDTNNLVEGSMARHKGMNAATHWVGSWVDADSGREPAERRGW